MRSIARITAWVVAVVSVAASFADAIESGDPAPRPIKSYRRLAKMLEDRQPQYLFLNSGGRVGNAPAGALAMDNAGGGAAVATEAGDAKYSDTNVQVAGVDEADIVKTDGKYLYHASRGRILVTRAYPETELAVKSIIAFDSEFWPIELFVDDEWLIVIGSAMRTEPVERMMPVFPATVKALLYDITDKTNCVLAREIELDGSYLSSRKIGKSVYIVARKYPDYYALAFGGGMGGATGGAIVANVQTDTAAGIRAAQRTVRPRRVGLVPALKDTARGPGPRRIKPRDVFYFPEFTEPDYLLVAGFNLNEMETPAEVKVFLGAGQAAYASRENLYVADTKYLPFFGGAVPGGGPEVVTTGTTVRAVAQGAPAPAVASREGETEATSIYRFALDDGHVTFSARGEVPGTVANQFAMDEKDGTFRVATTTTSYETWTTTNNVYVLNADMAIMGRLEGLAPGERIFSTRFIGDRCYLVTFRMVDPLFVISLADPAAPAVLGQLKIPGFSDYLHPYDDNHILGFGKDAVDGLYQGMKIACFDVTDVANPIQQHAVVIGDRGTQSEVLYNHKALLFDKAKNLLAFPITVAQIPNKTADTPPWTYGDVTFQGAHVYDFTLENGFVLRKAITHQTAEQYGMYYYEPDIRRLLYIEQNLYSISEGKIMVHDLGTMNEKGSLVLP
jgi:uncharacterized secreted protein with C-terminal beta-propeller domain